MRKMLWLVVFIAVITLNMVPLVAADSRKNPSRAVTPPFLMIADFESRKMKNSLGGKCGTWDVDPEDPSQFCKSLLVRCPDLDGSKYCLQLDYDVESEIPSESGLWMEMMYGDFSGYDHLEFYVKGDEKRGFTTKFKIQFSKWKTKKKKEKIQTLFIVKNVSNYWQKVVIPLNKLNGFASRNSELEWRDILEFSINFVDRLVDKKVGTIYFDNIAFVKTTDPGPHIYDSVPRRVPKTSLKLDALGWAHFLMERLPYFPKKVVVDYDFPKDDRAFLKKIAKDTWKYFKNTVDKDTGLPLDYVLISDNASRIKNPVVGDYTNITNIGLYLMALVGSGELNFISREEALKRARVVIHSLEKVEKHYDYFYNYYDTTNLERTSNFISSVDSGWLIAGLCVIKNYFPKDKALQRAIRELLDGYNFKIFYNDLAQHLSHGYYVNLRSRAAYDYGVFYSESRLASYIGIARGDIPKEHWFKMARTFPPSFSWQNLKPKNYKERECLGIKYWGGHYEYLGFKYIPSWGGSLFEALMPSLVLDEKDLAPQALGKNNLTHILAHIKYAEKELGLEVWGMSPCAVPEGGYSEYGVKKLGAKGYYEGVVTPHVTCLALEYVPKEAVKNLRKMLELYKNIYGEYGFYDAVNVKTGKVPYKYLALDQGMSFVALANYLTKGKIREYFNKEPIFKESQELISQEKFFD